MARRSELPKGVAPYPGPPQDPSPTGEPIYFDGWGFGVEPCPSCHKNPSPGDKRVTVPGVWRVFHAVCYDLEDLL